MQPKSMFVVVKSDFGLATKSLSMFIPFNIDFGCLSQPKSAFNSVNTDFGWGGCVVPPARAAANRFVIKTRCDTTIDR
ncbi:hypothetical protein LBMAG42_50520 [Deltaproteobacteria bacterium]|nr:hypothetical protein LBMAG42_50520 [Deltaproteobacteria bacterium]